jgi:hypothetical protein
VGEWFERTLAREPRFVEAVEAARELEDAQAEAAAAEEELVAFVTTAAALEPGLFQRGVDARQSRLDTARQAVATLGAQARALPVSGRLVDVWTTLEVGEKRAVLAGYLDRVTVRRGASAGLPGNVEVVWADGTVADTEERVLVAAA